MSVAPWRCIGSRCRCAAGNGEVISLRNRQWLGSGTQWLSWVHRHDVIQSILFLLGRDDLHGPFNVTSPQPVTGRDFCTALQAHHRTFIRVGVPAPVMNLMVGEMANELLLKGQRVLPESLRTLGFNFEYSDLTSALSEIYQAHTSLHS